MRWVLGVCIGFALVVSGCGGAKASNVDQIDEGEMAATALRSSDVHSTLCPVRGGTYSRGEWTRPDGRMMRSAAPVVLEDLTPPQMKRAYPDKPWVTKAPIAVRLDGEPVEVAVMDSGDAKVGLVYDAWPKAYSPEAAYEKIRFLPCEGDPKKPTWFGWPGAIVADEENVCLKLAVREGDGEISLLQVPLGDACPDGTD